MRFIFIVIGIVILTGCVSVYSERPSGLPDGRSESVTQDLSNQDRIFVESRPAGATVLLNDEVKGLTPMDIKLPRSEKSQRLKIAKEGFKTEEITLTPTVEDVTVQKENMLVNSTAFFGGVGLVAGLVAGAPVTGLLGGSAFGLIVGLLQEEKGLDANYEYSPESINIKLIPLVNN